jgi:ABC-type phosphate transport system auxiliary subunit
LPSIIAFVGWLYVYFSSGLPSIGLSLAWIAAGVVAFLIWARVEHFWPFGVKEIREYEQEADESAVGTINRPLQGEEKRSA